MVWKFRLILPEGRNNGKGNGRSYELPAQENEEISVDQYIAVEDVLQEEGFYSPSGSMKSSSQKSKFKSYSFEICHY